MNDISQFDMADAAELEERADVPAPMVPTDVPDGCGVFRAITAVMAEVSEKGLAKTRTNTQQNYSFRGIDDAYNLLSPILAAHHLCILPRMVDRKVVEKGTRNGGSLFYVTVEAEFDFILSDDGSRYTVRTYGEAMDSADKATNKAMSAAYKYAVMQTFCIPTEGDNDADATTHDVASDSGGNRQRNQRQGGGRQQRQQGNDRQKRGRNDAANPMPDEEWSNLANLLRATNSIAGDLCEHYGVSNLRLLNEDAYRDAIALLKTKLERLKNQQRDNGQQRQGRQQDNRQGGNNNRPRANGRGNFDANDLPRF